MAKRSRPRITVDLGCGVRKMKGALGVDTVAVPGVDVVADLNRGRNIVIHTIAIEPSKSSGSFLKTLAKANEGQYAARGGEKDDKKKKKKK